MDLILSRDMGDPMRSKVGFAAYMYCRFCLYIPCIYNMTTAQFVAGDVFESAGRFHLDLLPGEETFCFGLHLEILGLWMVVLWDQISRCPKYQPLVWNTWNTIMILKAIRLQMMYEDLPSKNMVIFHSYLKSLEGTFWKASSCETNQNPKSPKVQSMTKSVSPKFPQLSPPTNSAFPFESLCDRIVFQ